MNSFNDNAQLFSDNLLMSYHENLQICNIAMQELQKEYDRFKRDRTIKEEITYYKECYPLIAKWQIYYNYFALLEQELFISSDDMRSKMYKNCISKLNNLFKKK